MSSTSQFLGLDSFVWFQGVVEDRLDPLKLGRVRVRVLGLHTEDKKYIPTEDLPWAHPISPITSAAMTGIGVTPLGPVEGTWVVGFFRDGENCQEPVIMGTLLGIPQSTSNKSIGFNDPKGKYPKADYIKEPDLNRLARNEKLSETIVETKKKNRDLAVPVALDADDPWDEPEPYYGAEYPFNHVTESESGHIFEVDDTQGHERLAEWHRKGTFYEIGPDGSKISKIVTDNYSIIAKGDYVHIGGVCNVTIGGDCNLLVNGEANIEVNNNVTAILKGDVKVDIGGSFSLNVAKDFSTQAGNNINIIAGNDIVEMAEKDFNLIADRYISVSAGGDLQLAAQDTIVLKGNKKLDLSTLGTFALKANDSANIDGGKSTYVSGGLIEISSLSTILEKATGQISILSLVANQITRGGLPFWN